jgi:hypothetical protein
VASFADRHPVLFHVTERASVPSIRRHGLLSASALCQLFEVPAGRRSALLDANRERYELIEHPQHGSTVLRRQLMRDHAMLTRLAPGMGPPAWRRFINGMVFFVVDEARAARLRDYDREREQVILAWGTSALMDAGAELLACRYNNGMMDRTPPHRRRLRSRNDYVAVSQYAGGFIAEVASATPIPATVPFILWHPPLAPATTLDPQRGFRHIDPR